MITLIQADARALPLADASVDLIVTSPPYWGLRSYQDAGQHFDGQIGAEATPSAYIDSLVKCTAEWKRALKPGGSIWVNLGDKYSDRGHGPSRGRGPQAETLRQTRGPREKSLLGMPQRYVIRCMDDLDLLLRAEVIWSKPNGLPESVRDRVRRSHETWFHFVQSRHYFSSVDAIREPVGPAKSRGRNPNGPSPDNWDRGRPTTTPNPLGKLPGSVWEIATQPLQVPAEVGVDHFAAFPMEWPRRIISGWSPADGTVLDPFGGTGTTALVADVLGRHGISVDMSSDYLRIARWRTTDPRQRARAAGVRTPRRHAESFDCPEQGLLITETSSPGGVS
jgi:DNA modification methylase